MKYLSFITALILLATLFSFVFTQLNKDETKHEYGIAFPLEESESRLPSMSAVMQAEPTQNVEQNTKSNVVTLNEQPTASSSSITTTSTEVIPTAASQEELESSKSAEESTENDNNPSLVIESVSNSAANQNETDSTKDIPTTNSNEEITDSPSPSNPKLILIERLMGLNFQRAPASGFSSFLEVRDEEKTVPNKTDSTEEDSSKDSHSSENDWSNTLDNIRTRWESRIRKFALPFQNSYSVVLRASNVVDSSEQGGKDGENSDNDTNESQDKFNKSFETIASAEPSLALNPNKYFTQTATPLSASSANDQQQQQAAMRQHSQILRMAALTMMSKLMSAIRTQDAYPNKLESAHRLAESGDSRDLELDDDDDDDHDERSRPNFDEIPHITFGGDSMSFVKPLKPQAEEQSMRNQGVNTAVMYGRPAMPSSNHQQPTFDFASSRTYSSPVSPLGVILSAIAASSARQPTYRRFEASASPMPSEPQPQRLILVINHRGSSEQLSSQEEQKSYMPSMSHYSPLTAPSSPIYYHYGASSQLSAPRPAPVSQKPQVIEVPVPVYVPMPVRVSSPRSMMRPVMPPPSPLALRRYPSRMPAIGAPAATAALPMMSENQPQAFGHVSIMYVHSPESDQTSIGNGAQESQPQPQLHTSVEPESNGVLRILLRSKLSPPAPVTPPVANQLHRIVFHRRLDDSEEENHIVPNMIHEMTQENSRIRPWREYNQMVRSFSEPPAPVAAPVPPSPVAHFLIATSARDDVPEGSSTEEHYQTQPGRHVPFYSLSAENSENFQQNGPIGMAHQAQLGHHFPSPQQPQLHHTEPAPMQTVGGHAAFLIVAEPQNASQDSTHSNQDV